MKKIKIILALQVGLALIATANAAAAVHFKVFHSPAADAYVILDQLSMWSKDECEPEYRAYWEKRFGISKEDDAALAAYREIRTKHTGDGDQTPEDPRKNRNGFFAKIGAVTADPIGNAFYSSLNLNEAYAKLKGVLNDSEIDFLKSFYGRFQSKWKVLVDDMSVFDPAEKTVQRALSKSKVEKFFNEVSVFYKVKKDVDFNILYVWWPPMNRTLATPIGSTFLMFLNPQRNASIGDKEVDIAIHEVVHAISTLQDLSQKQELTKQFLDVCDLSVPPAHLEKVEILEEPLAVAFGQIIFWERFDPSQLHREQRLKRNPYISLFGKLIAPLAADSLREKKTITDGFILTSAKLCNELKLAVPYVIGK